MTDVRGSDADSMAQGGVSRWRYRAADADGSDVRGEIDAASEREAIDALRRRSLWVIELAPTRAPTRGLTRGVSRDATEGTNGAPSRHAPSGERWFAQLWREPENELAVMVRAIATLLAAGVPLVRALAYASEDATSQRLRDGFHALHEALQRGSSLSDAVAAQPLFPPVFSPLIAAGERTGTLATSLTMLADHLENRAALRHQLRSALIYPCILAVASVVGVMVIMLVVVPRFAALVSDGGGSLPASTRALIAASTVVSRGGWAILLGAGALALAFRGALRDPASRRRIDERALSLPMIGSLMRTRAAAGYTGTLAIALRAGVSLPAAMGLARAVVHNRSLHESLRDAELRVLSGSTLSQSLSGLLSPLTERLLDAGEASGDISGMAARAAEASEALLQRTVTRAVALIEPVMILGFGGVVGFVALALLQAIYGLNASVL